MESAQRDMISVLLRRLLSLGLIAKSTYLGAEDLVHSVIDFGELFEYPVCLTKEAGIDERTQDTQ